MTKQPSKQLEIYRSFPVCDNAVHDNHINSVNARNRVNRVRVIIFKSDSEVGLQVTDGVVVIPKFVKAD